MATLVLGALGQAAGASLFSGTFLGLSGGAIGGMLGASVGSMIDAGLVAGNQNQRVDGARLDGARLLSSVEGAVVPRVYGRVRVGGNLIWATDFREELTETVIRGARRYGLFGPRSRTVIEEYSYFASFAIAICEGPISGIGRVWADGRLQNLSDATFRWYRGGEEQEPDPYIASRMGDRPTPAYRGTAYVVFEEFLLEDFSNRIPQFTFEVFRPIDTDATMEGMLRAVSLIPGSGEAVLATEQVVTGSGGAGSNAGDDRAINKNFYLRSKRIDGLDPEPDPETDGAGAATDFEIALDDLTVSCPGIESVLLVVSWYGTDLRAGECEIRPKVEQQEEETSPRWSVNGVEREDALVVSQVDGRPAFGGTPSDRSVLQAIRAIKARGLRVIFYPFVMMDVPEGNTLPNPYSDNAGEAGQPVYPWRGRITCSPAAGFEGTVDKTATAGAQVESFFGSAAPADYAVGGAVVEWTGGSDWGLRRMILHYAHLCEVAGGVDAFVIGSEMRELTQIRSDASTYPAVAQFVSLAAAVRSIVGAECKISYAADWSEYFGHQPGDGTGDVFFHLDPLWSDDEIDFIGIDNYMPLSDWRDGFEHADATGGVPAIYDRSYLQGNIEGGEGFDWFYPDASARAGQERSAIEDGAAGKPWVFRYKDLRSWWSELHFNRPGGVEADTPTGWVPQSKPIWFTEFGCPAVDRGTNQPNVFFDPKSSESFVPHFSRGWRDDVIQRAYIEATLAYWRDPENNPESSVYSGRMIDTDEAHAWTWDARPYPAFPALEEIWADGENWRRGHWLTGRLGSVQLGALVKHLCERAGTPGELVDVSQLWGAVEGYVIGALESPRVSIAMLARHFGFDAVESEGRIVFRMRGCAPALVLTIDDLVEPEGDTGDVIEISRGQETELPDALKWQFLRSDKEYEQSAAEARRQTTGSARETLEVFHMAVPPEETERRARRALMEAWVGRERLSFRLPPSRLAIDPTDVIALQHDGRQIPMRVTQTRDELSRVVEAVMADRDVYDLPPGDPRPAFLRRIDTFVSATVLLMNLPTLRDGDAAHEPYIAAWARVWPGRLSIYRSATLEGFDLLDTISVRGQIGRLLEPMPAGPVSRIDQGTVTTVEMFSGQLVSVSDTDMFAGANAFAVETDPGVWEVFQAAQAELVGTRQYRLSRMLRGVRGTEGSIRAEVAAGARVVALDSAVLPVPIAQGDVGQEWNWRVGPVFAPIDDPSYVAEEFAPTGRGLLPFSVVHVEQPFRRGRTLGDLTIRWTRRSRDFGADSWEASEVPLGEASEAYEVDILDGGTVLRTLATTTTSALYSQAQQVADWGAALGPGDTLDIRVAQLSQTVGRGAVREVTLQF